MAHLAPAVDPRRSRVFLAMGVIALAAVMVGFFLTFTRPMWRGEFHAPAVVFWHGAFLLAWVLLFLSQSLLVQRRQVATHRTLGWIGLALVPCVVLSTFAVGVFALRRDVAAGGGETAISSIVGNFTSPLLFAGLVAAAVANRRRRDFHSRLMVLALLAILWPAFARFRHYFPPIPRPDIWFGFALPNALILLAMLRDRLRLGRVHPVYQIVGLFLIVESAIETAVFAGPGWGPLGHWLASFFLP